MEINYPPGTETWMCALTDSWGLCLGPFLEVEIRTGPFSVMRKVMEGV